MEIGFQVLLWISLINISSLILLGCVILIEDNFNIFLPTFINDILIITSFPFGWIIILISIVIWGYGPW